MSFVLDDWWDLDADTDYLYTASTAWANLATHLGDESTAVGNREEELRLNWQCSMADSYFEHASRLSKAFGNASDVSGDVADVLTKLKDHIRDAEDELNESFSRATANATYMRWFGSIQFLTYEDESEIRSENEKAKGIVESLTKKIDGHRGTLQEVVGEASGIKSNWAAAAAGDDPGWDVPTGTTYGVQVTSLDGTTAVTTGDGSDAVEVTVDPDTGETIVTITDSMGNETVERVPAGNEVVINTGKGNDEITVPRGTNVNVRFATGAGDDTVSGQGSEGDIETFGGDGVDTIETGTGDDYTSGGRDSDYVDGGAGNDVLAGRLGNDTIYGMDGHDVVVGGDGQDYLEGAKGNDTIFGGADGDVVSGGYGDDNLFGGDNADTIYAGGGDDAVDGGRGHDDAFVEAGDVAADAENSVVVEIPPKEEYLRWLEIETSGSPEFQDRVLADLAMMASSPVGQKMLERQGEHYDHSDDGWFDFSKEKVTIREHPGGNNSASYSGDDYAVELDVNHTSQGYPMGYDDPDYDVTPPNVFFFHELGHINQYRSGEHEQFTDPSGNKRTYSDGTPLIERQNVGLEWDADGDGDEEIDPEYDFDYTENGFRGELGLPERNQY